MVLQEININPNNYTERAWKFVTNENYDDFRHELLPDTRSGEGGKWTLDDCLQTLQKIVRLPVEYSEEDTAFASVCIFVPIYEGQWHSVCLKDIYDNIQTEEEAQIPRTSILINGQAINWEVPYVL